jgi:hypothetical protein
MGSAFLLLVAASVIVWAIRQYNAAKKTNAPTVSFNVGYDEPEEEPDWSAEDFKTAYRPRPVKAQIKMRYRDSKGEMTERVVDVRECDTWAPDGYLNGFCHTRGAIRTFRLDRIESAIDVETGELIHNLNDYADKKYEESPVAAVDKLFETHSDALRVLFYIAKADGKFTAKEKDIYLDYCRSVHPDDRLNTQVIDSALKWVEIPSAHSYKVICGKLAKLDDPTKAAILEAAEAMIATQKTVSPEEELAINYIKKRFAAGK